jgi:Fic family protein
MHIETCRPQHLPVKKLEWSRLISLIGDARETVARLDAELNVRQAASLLEPIQWLEAIASLHSQKIEADFEEILSYVFAKSATEKKAALLQKIVGAKEALAVGNRYLRRRLGAQFFCKIHAQIKKDGPASPDTGRLRNRQNWIGAEGCEIEEAYFYPPKPREVRPLLRNLESYLAKSDLDPLVQMAIAFAQFLIIHPFMDGNGRVARVLVPVYACQTKLLSHPALFLSEYFEAHRIDYFQKLFWISEKRKWEEWIAYFLKGVISQAQKTRARLLVMKNLFKQVEILAGFETAENLFRQPLILKKSASKKLIKQKILIAQGQEHYLLAPLVRAMRTR